MSWVKLLCQSTEYIRQAVEAQNAYDSIQEAAAMGDICAQAIVSKLSHSSCCDDCSDRGHRCDSCSSSCRDE